MQPPPRKVKHATALKNIHSEQVSKLQAKLQQEYELLEDIRTFSRQKSIIEKEYGQALLKLTSSLLKREFQAMPELKTGDGEEYRTALAVWRVMLEETEKVAKSRIQAAEIYMEKIAEPLKPLKAAKVQCQKKMMPHLTVLQNEVGQTVLEMVKSQKTYNVDETLAHDARQKAAEANARLAKRSTGIFQSLASLQKNCAKHNNRKDSSEAKSALSRNEYLLNMSAANAHQSRYYDADLPDLFQTLDGDMFEKIREYFDILGTSALDVSTLEKTCSESIVEQATMIDRLFNHKVYLYRNNIFTNPVQYQFQPCQNDQCNVLSKEHGGDLQLDKEARKWATKIAKEMRASREHQRTLQALESQLSGDRTSENGTTEGSTSQEIETKIEEMKHHIRKAETAKMKAEARIELLRQASVNVDEWIASAQAESLRAEEEMSRTSSRVSLRTESSGGKSDDMEPTYTNYDDDDDFIDDTFDVNKDQSFGSYGSHDYQSQLSSQFPIRCRAIYDFQGSNTDELNLAENEELEVLADDDGDGWVRARNAEGQVGYIPQNYIEMFNSESSCDAAGHVSLPDIETPGSNDAAQEVTSYSSGDIEVQKTTSEMFVDNQIPPSEGIWARALYDYEACSEDELSFAEGTLIKILRKDENGVDDGFWEGEMNGRIGVFPSLMVEELANSGPDQSSLELQSPPGFMPPPPVMITAATPETENPPSMLPNGTGYRLKQYYDDYDEEQRAKYSHRVVASKMSKMYNRGNYDCRISTHMLHRKSDKGYSYNISQTYSRHSYGSNQGNYKSHGNSDKRRGHIRFSEEEGEESLV